MGPATMTRGFMGLLSESQDHLDDAEVRVRGVRVPPSRVGEPDPLEADGGLVAFGDLQFELLQLAGAGPVRREESRIQKKRRSTTGRIIPTVFGRRKTTAQMLRASSDVRAG